MSDQTNDPAKPDPRDQLVLDEARRGLEQQKRDLEGLRSRAGAQAGYAIAIAAFLGGLALRDGGKPTCTTWFALECLAVVIGCSLVVLAPRKLTLALDAAAMDARIDEGHTISQMTRDTSLALVRDKNANQAKLDRLHWAYFVSLIALVGEATLFLIDLTRR